MNVVGVLDRWAIDQPEQAAIIATRGAEDTALSYASLRDASSRLAGALRRRGVRPGDNVAVLVGLSVDLYIALIGALWAGAVPVIVDPGAGLGRARSSFRRAPPRALVGSRRLLLLARLLPELRTQPAVHVRARGAAAEIEDRPEDAAALLTFTSGSTGVPSAVARSHALLIAQNAALQEVLGHRPGERWLATLPIFVLAHLAEGATAILADADLRRPGFIDGARLARQVARCRADSVVASPSLLRRLADVESNGRAFRSVFTGGAPVLPSTVERLRRLSEDGEIVVVYGSTEAEPIAHHVCAPGCDWDRSIQGAGLLVGRPCSAVQVRVIRDSSGGPIPELTTTQFEGLCVAPGEPGEIVVTGRHVVKGYLDGHGDRENKIRVVASGESTVWHRTGDAARFDGHGRLWLLGRCIGRVTLRNGRIKYPFEIEAPVTERVGVPCALVPTPDGATLVLGQADEASRRSSIEAAETLVEREAKVVSIPRIPLDKRHNAKVDYSELRRILARRGIG